MLKIIASFTVFKLYCAWGVYGTMISLRLYRLTIGNINNSSAIESAYYLQWHYTLEWAFICLVADFLIY